MTQHWCDVVMNWHLIFKGLLNILFKIRETRFIQPHVPHRQNGVQAFASFAPPTSLWESNVLPSYLQSPCASAWTTSWTWLLWDCVTQSLGLGCRCFPSSPSMSLPTFLHTKVQKGRLQDQNLDSLQMHRGSGLDSLRGSTFCCTNTMCFSCFVPLVLTNWTYDGTKHQGHGSSDVFINSDDSAQFNAMDRTVDKLQVSQWLRRSPLPTDLSEPLWCHLGRGTCSVRAGSLELLRPALSWCGPYCNCRWSRWTGPGWTWGPPWRCTPGMKRARKQNSVDANGQCFLLLQS